MALIVSCKPFVNPADCMAAAMAWWIEYIGNEFVGIASMYASGFEGNECIYIEVPGTLNILWWLFPCLGLKAGEIIPGAYGVAPQQLDVYLNSAGNTLVTVLTPAVVEGDWYYVVSQRMQILERWYLAEWDILDVETNSEMGGKAQSFNVAAVMRSAANTVYVNNVLWWVFPGTTLDYEVSPVQGMTPQAVARQPPPAYASLGMGQVVKALEDIAHRTTVWQINNRGAIADLSSGDVVAPGGTDVPE